MAKSTRAKAKITEQNVQIVTDYDVYDQNGELQSAEWLYQNFDGAEVLRSTADVAKTFRIKAVYITEGPVTFVAEARNESGGPQVGQYVAFSYPSLETPDPRLVDISMYNIPTMWCKRSVQPQKTNAEGITGFGLGSAFGPFYHSFILSPTASSDCMTKAGMKGGTNHVGPLHVVWQLEETGTSEFLPWDEPEAPANVLMEKVRWWTEEMVRARENGQMRRADKIQYALIDLERGLMYRLENLIKSGNMEATG